MKEMEKSISVLRVETSLPEEAAPSGEEAAVQPAPEAQNSPAERPTIVVEIVDMRLHVALARRQQNIMNRSMRHWTKVSSTDVGKSNFPKITF